MPLHDPTSEVHSGFPQSQTRIESASRWRVSGSNKEHYRALGASAGALQIATPDRDAAPRDSLSVGTRYLSSCFPRFARRRDPHQLKIPGKRAPRLPRYAVSPRGKSEISHRVSPFADASMSVSPASGIPPPVVSTAHSRRLLVTSDLKRRELFPTCTVEPGRTLPVCTVRTLPVCTWKSRRTCGRCV